MEKFFAAIGGLVAYLAGLWLICSSTQKGNQKLSQLSFPKQCLHSGVLTDFQETYGSGPGCALGARGREVVVKIDTT